jgi:bifunctional UDP-N-acetylglucosamine pyrophosphorylase / glucosamine-1-phosphate N-acetyltransferase
MKKLAIVILAAGQGTRMKSEKAKVLHSMLGRAMIHYPLAVAEALKPERVVVVVGVQAEAVKAELAGRKVRFAPQKEQLGTGHAVMAAMPALKGFAGDVMVLYGDSPLLTAETLKALAARHRGTRAAMSLITVNFANPFGYGRIIRDQRGAVREIVEEKDCTPEQRLITESNPGIYIYDLGFLRKALPKIKNRNQQKEYYLTDLLGIAVGAGARVESAQAADPREVLGFNCRWELASAAAIMQERINRAHCEAGVTIESPMTVIIEPDVKIGKDTVIEPGARITGRSVIGAGCVIESCARISDSTIGPGARIKAGSVIEDSFVQFGADIGPMAHLRPGSDIGAHAHLGNFVETKKAKIGAGTKISHLTYVGDAVIGQDVNLGCGFITCNYDGVHKHQTVIEDNVFVGSDTQAVAPLKIGRGAYIGSGSTLTRDIPPGALALTRAPLVIKEGWATKRAASDKKKKSPRGK